MEIPKCVEIVKAVIVKCWDGANASDRNELIKMIEIKNQTVYDKGFDFLQAGTEAGFVPKGVYEYCMEYFPTAVDVYNEEFSVHDHMLYHKLAQSAYECLNENRGRQAQTSSGDDLTRQIDQVQGLLDELKGFIDDIDDDPDYPKPDS